MSPGQGHSCSGRAGEEHGRQWGEVPQSSALGSPRAAAMKGRSQVPAARDPPPRPSRVPTRRTRGGDVKECGEVTQGARGGDAKGARGARSLRRR